MKVFQEARDRNARFYTIMSTPPTNLDVLTPSGLDLNEPYIWGALAVMLASISFNATIAIRASLGWLINPRITKQVTVACSLAAIWMSFYVSRIFAWHRSFSILIAWTGYPLTLMIVLQHIELLKLFVSLSDFWTARKCRIFQLIASVLHVLICLPQYIYPFGLENNATMNRICDILTIVWVSVVVIFDNFCAATSIQLMWRHLNEAPASSTTTEGPPKLIPKKRYYKVVAWMVSHAFLDVFAVILYALSGDLPQLQVNPNRKFFLYIFSTTIAAFHVGFYPLVYCQVRDLKFRDQLKQREGSSVSPVKEAVIKILGQSNTKSSATGTKIKNSSLAAPLSPSGKPVLDLVPESAEDQAEDTDPKVSGPSTVKRAPTVAKPAIGVVSEWTASQLE